MTGNKKKVVRFAGFATALAVSAVLVSTAVQTTGAYFSDSAAGSITAGSGHLTLGHGVTDLNYADLMPGQNQDQSVTYSVSVSSGGVDLWMVFDPSDPGYQALTGGKDSPSAPDGGLGRYGYFKVGDSNGGLAFRSGNLSYDVYGTSHNQYGASGYCPVDANGRGGSDWIATAADHQATQFCGIPSAILLASNLQDTATGTVTVTFGLDGYMQFDQGQAYPKVPFTLVATQHNVRPEAGNTYGH